jgi:uncharacterized protein (DUF433 family)
VRPNLASGLRFRRKALVPTVFRSSILALMPHERITIDPDVMFGKPVIRDTRIPVERILRKLGSGQSVASVLDDHPHLSEHDVHAALRFAADYMADEDVVSVGETTS